MSRDSTGHCSLDFVAIEQESSGKIESVRMRPLSEGGVSFSVYYFRSV
jgi:hypothetical protein